MLFCPLGGGGTDCNNTSCGEQGPLYTSSRHAATSPFICRSSATLYWSSTLGDLLIDPAWLLAVMRLDSYSMYACNELVWAQSARGIQLGVQQCDATKRISSVARIQNKKLRPHMLQNVQSVHWRQFFWRTRPPRSVRISKRSGNTASNNSIAAATHRACWWLRVYCEWWDEITDDSKLNQPNYICISICRATQLSFWFDFCNPLPLPCTFFVSLAYFNIFEFSPPLSRSLSLSLAASSRQIKPGAFDVSVMDDFCWVENDGLFPWSLSRRRQRRLPSRQGSVGTKEEFRWFCLVCLWCNRGFDWRSFISVFLSLFPLLMRLSLDLTDCLMMPLRRFSLSPSLLFGLICFFCSTFLWISVDRRVDNNQRKVASLAQA